MIHQHVDDACADSGTERNGPPQAITTRELMGSSNELIIHHAGQQYRLRITRQQKLILTK